MHYVLGVDNYKVAVVNLCFSCSNFSAGAVGVVGAVFRRTHGKDITYSTLVEFLSYDDATGILSCCEMWYVHMMLVSFISTL